jgi:hypothetical protein
MPNRFNTLLPNEPDDREIRRLALRFHERGPVVAADFLAALLRGRLATSLMALRVIEHPERFDFRIFGGLDECELPRALPAPLPGLKQRQSRTSQPRPSRSPLARRDPARPPHPR